MKHETSTLYLLSDSTQEKANEEGHVIDLINKSLKEKKDVVFINAEQLPKITVRSISQKNRMERGKGTVLEVIEKYMSKGNTNVVVFFKEPRTKDSTNIQACMTWANVINWP